jgi:hypothetical protein
LNARLAKPLPLDFKDEQYYLTIVGGFFFSKYLNPYLYFHAPIHVPLFNKVFKFHLVSKGVE